MAPGSSAPSLFFWLLVVLLSSQLRHSALSFSFSKSKSNNNLASSPVAVLLDEPNTPTTIPRRHKKSQYPRVRLARDHVAPDASHLYLQTAPLIGGPKFLPVHVQVVVKVVQEDDDAVQEANDDDVFFYFMEEAATTTQSPQQRQRLQYYTYDLIPSNATQRETLQALLQLKQVPGTLRYDVTSTSTFSRRHDDVLEQTDDNNRAALSSSSFQRLAHEFYQQYPTEQPFHLVTNNCWVFAGQMVWHILTKSKTAAAAATPVADP